MEGKGLCNYVVTRLLNENTNDKELRLVLRVAC
jgi:hypothetical protein